MTYRDTIEGLARKVPPGIVDFNTPRLRSSPPTQASSEFITNREQRDWAERLILQAINKISQNFVAVRYGRAE